MNHTIYCYSTRKPIDALPMHVVAYAYREAWRSLHGRDPQGKHVIDELDLMIDFARPNAEDQ